MRSPYGRIFAQPTPPDALQARHGDLWVSPLGLQFFSRTPDQVGNPGTGVWTAVQTAPATAEIVANYGASGTVFSASGGTSGQLRLTATANIANNDDFDVDSLSTSVDAAILGQVSATIVSTTSTNLASIAAAVTATGVITITLTATNPAQPALPNGAVLVVAFYAY